MEWMGYFYILRYWFIYSQGSLFMKFDFFAMKQASIICFPKEKKTLFKDSKVNQEYYVGYGRTVILHVDMTINTHINFFDALHI